MSWVNLDDVYVNKTGDTIAGDLSVGGALTINDGKGTYTTYNVANEITTLRDSVCASILSLETMTKGSAVDIPDLNKWMVIGMIVEIAVDGDEKRNILVPCCVSGDGFVSGSLGYVEKSGITLVAVTMRIWSNGLNYGDCVVQKVGSTSVMLKDQPISGIFGLIRTCPEFLE